MTLVPAVSKVFGRILIKRIKKAIDPVLRREHAGFQEKRSTTEQIFILKKHLGTSK